MAQLGPLARGLLLAGGTVAGRILAEGEPATILADMAMHLGSQKARELFGSAIEGFRSDVAIEKSTQKAPLQALARLRTKAPRGSDKWFDD